MEVSQGLTRRGNTSLRETSWTWHALGKMLICLFTEVLQPATSSVQAGW